MWWAGMEANRAVVNDSPVGCQSRERASPAGEVESIPAHHTREIIIVEICSFALFIGASHAMIMMIFSGMMEDKAYG